MYRIVYGKRRFCLLVATATACSQPCPLPSPSPSTFIPTRSVSRSIRAFPLISFQLCRALLFFLPSHLLSGSFALIHRGLAPRPSIVDVSRPIIVARRRRTAKEGGQRGERGRDFPLPPPPATERPEFQCHDAPPAAAKQPKNSS